MFAFFYGKMQQQNKHVGAAAWSTSFTMWFTFLICKFFAILCCYHWWITNQRKWQTLNKIKCLQSPTWMLSSSPGYLNIKFFLQSHFTSPFLFSKHEGQCWKSSLSSLWYIFEDVSTLRKKLITEVVDRGTVTALLAPCCSGLSKKNAVWKFIFNKIYPFSLSHYELKEMPQ